MADPMSNYFAARHAPQANVADPELFGRNPVGSFSRPAQDADVQGTGALLSGPKRNRPRGAHAIGSLDAVQGPLDLDAHESIIEASGLGRQAPKSPGEEMSDADEPTQGVEARSDGSMMHHRMNPATGQVTSTPVGSPGSILDRYPSLNYQSMPRNLGELQGNLGTENLFGAEG